MLTSILLVLAFITCGYTTRKWWRLVTHVIRRDEEDERVSQQGYEGEKEKRTHVHGGTHKVGTGEQEQTIGAPAKTQLHQQPQQLQSPSSIHTVQIGPDVPAITPQRRVYTRLDRRSSRFIHLLHAFTLPSIRLLSLCVVASYVLFCFAVSHLSGSRIGADGFITLCFASFSPLIVTTTVYGVKMKSRLTATLTMVNGNTRHGGMEAWDGRRRHGMAWHGMSMSCDVDAVM